MLKNEIINALNSGLTLNQIDSLSETLNTMITEGIKNDCDAVCFVDRIDNRLILIITVGSTMLSGPDAKQYLIEYHSHIKSKYESFIDQLSINAEDELKNDSALLTIIKDTSSQKWRSYKRIQDKLMNIDQVRKRARLLK